MLGLRKEVEKIRSGDEEDVCELDGQGYASVLQLGLTTVGWIVTLLAAVDKKLHSVYGSPQREGRQVCE